MPTTRSQSEDEQQDASISSKILADGEEDKMAAELATQMKMLKFLDRQTEELLGNPTENEKKLKRQKKNLEEKVNKVHELIIQIVEKKFTEGVAEQEVNEWSTQQENYLSEFERSLESTETALKRIERHQEEKKTLEAERRENEKRQKDRLEQQQQQDRQREFELELEEKRLQKFKEQQTAKLPKLVITKFEGTALDWVRFWEQFEAEIDKSNRPAITKFSYLRELLSDKPKCEILGLPFNEHGYEKAKKILKERYGDISNIIQAHGREIMNLPKLTSVDLMQIHAFHRKLNVSVNSLKTLGKLDTAEILVRETLDKLGSIKSDLIRTDPNWQNWGFNELVEALKQYTLRNPCTENTPKVQHEKPKAKREKNFQTEVRKIKCVFCGSEEHKSAECDVVKSVNERKEILKKNKLCYNCTRSNHTIAKCRSGNCLKCNKKHHTSICNSHEEAASATSHYYVNTAKETIHPTITVVVKGEKFRVMLDTGAGSSFASSTFIQHVNVKPSHWEYKSIETMTTTVSQKMPVYEVKLWSTDGKKSLDVKLNKLDKPVLTTLNNPGVRELKKEYVHLKGIHFDSEDDRKEHPVHIILGVGDFTRIKTEECKVGETNQPYAEKTTFGWTLMGPGREETNALYFAKTTHEDYRELYSLDVLGLNDTDDGSQEIVHEEFREQLKRLPNGEYSTRLPWKVGHPELPDNKAMSNDRLNKLIRKLDRNPAIMRQYHEIIQEQIKEGIVEEAPEEPTGDKTFYMPHRPVIRETAQTTKIRIVYDASSKASPLVPSLNDCLEIGPSLQPLLHDVLIRNRVKPIGLIGDIKQAFHQIWVDPQDRDTLRFHWLSDLETRRVLSFRLTRVPFGIGSSPFLLGATLKEHLNNYHEEYPQVTDELKKSLYVDDVISGGDEVTEVIQFKEDITKIFSEGGFTLHKWHSTLPELEDIKYEEDIKQPEEHKENTNPPKLLGHHWNKVKDTIAVSFSECRDTKEFTKRGMLRAMAKVYDPLGLTSPIMLAAKNLYRLTCEESHKWDGPLRREIEIAWKKWLSNLPNEVTVPRSIATIPGKVTNICLHGFGDASKEGCCAVIYAVIQQEVNHETIKSQGLLVSKSRIAKRNLTIPRLELVAGHMVANLLHNIQKALEGYNITKVVAWLDSTVALFWIKSESREWKQFVSNRVTKIREKKGISWRYCPTGENPADVGSRGACERSIGELWWKGPTWLQTEEDWPEDITITESKETKEEAKQNKQVTMTAVEKETNVFYNLLVKFSMWKTLRITAWVRRFTHNLTRRKRRRGALTTTEIQEAESFWIKLVQKDATEEEGYRELERRLQLKPDPENIIRCQGRIQGEYPIFLPTTHLFSKRLTEDAHSKTLHGGVGITMAKVRERWWIERLRSLVKSVINKCNLCKRYTTKPFYPPAQAALPTFRTKGERAFETTGVDFAGPIQYKIKKKLKGKSYIALYTCATSRAVHLDLLPDMSAAEFKICLGEFIARRGKPNRIVSDNGKTFIATAKWLNKLKRDQVLNDYLAQRNITWQFNLSRSPWWGGFFERMVGVVKSALRKSIGNANLTFKQLKEVLLDVEVTVNNRPLGYLENDIQLPPLTPNRMLHGMNISLPEEDPEVLEDDRVMYKRAKYLKTCKDVMWNRWSTEYIKALRERHRSGPGKNADIQVGDIMIIAGKDKNRGRWIMGAVERLITGKDGVIRGAKLRTVKGVLERPVQLLYPLELRLEQNKSTEKLNPDAEEFTPRRLQRSAKSEANKKIKKLFDDSEEL